MSRDARLTVAQSDLVALLREVGGVIEEEQEVAIDLFPGDFRTNRIVRLTMTGDNLRRVRVLVGPSGDVKWEPISSGR